MVFATSVIGQPFTNTIIVRENQKNGTTNWFLAKPAPVGCIEGYASLTSVERGGQISFFVNTTNSSYVLEVFRLGWYAGAGARQVFGPVTMPGSVQTIPTPDPVSGFFECTWTNPYTLNVPATPDDPTDWASGVYLARLTGGQDGYQNYIIFIVRDDLRATDLLAQLSFTTYEAYNFWGGASLYRFNSSHSAWKVSFNRPFRNQFNPYWNGTGSFFSSVETGGAAWECNLLRWLEREGYDVSYCAGVDVHSNTNLLSNHKAFMSMGHDEYWSYPMRWNVETARDNGVNLAFLSGNTCYWQVRFEPGYDGTPNRTVVCYKQSPGATNSIDPISATVSNYLTTTQFRYPPVSDIESSLIGVSGDSWPLNNDLIINDPTHWAFAGTAVQQGQLLPGLFGYEIGSTNSGTPTNIQVACQSPYFLTFSPRFKSYSHVTSYVAPSGATVFASGSMQWSWGLDDFNAPAWRLSRQTPLAQQITRNVMARLLNHPAPSPTLFFRTDFNTAGNWLPSYGSEGYVLPGSSTNLPAFAILDSGTATVTNYPASSLDTNSLQQPSAAGRFLPGWTSPTNFILDVNLTDTSNHLAALYFWDWNNAGRNEMVEVLDVQTGNLLDQRTTGDLTKGQWWVWQLQGHVQLRITCLAGPDCLLNAFTLGSGAQVQFLGQDSLTQGNWPPYYGADGSYIAGQPPQPATYAGVSVLNGGVRWSLDSFWGSTQAFTNWSLDTPDPRAPAPYPNTRRVFAAWTSLVNFINTLDVKVTDNAWHQLAIYCVDPDNLGRSQLFSLVDPGNNLVLDTEVLTNFSGGKYLLWNFRGHLQVRFQNLNEKSAAVSGFFLDPPSQPPGVALTSPVASQTFTAPTNLTLTVSTNAPNGFITQVGFLANGNVLGIITNPPFTFTWSNAPVGSYSLTAVAVDNRRASAVSAPVPVSVNTPQGYQPPTVQLTSPLNGSSWTLPTNWVLLATANSTSAPIRSVQFVVDQAPDGSPITNSPFTLSISNLPPGRNTICVVAVDAFGVATVSATNSITVGQGTNSSPSVSFIAPTNGARFAAPAIIQLAAEVNCGGSASCHVQFFANGAPIGIASAASSYSFTWANVPIGSYNLTAQLVDTGGPNGVSASIPITVEAPAAAIFALSSTNLQGNWIGTYGNQGYMLAADSTNLPAYAQIELSSQLISWTNGTTDARALQSGSSTSRVAAAWYGFTNLTVDLDLTDGIYHRVGLYFLDWANFGVSQTVDVFNNLTAQNLDHRLLPRFANGLYGAWDIRGHVTFVFTPNNGMPALMSGLFLDVSPLLVTINITNPLNGALFTSPASFSVNADTTADPKITSVELYENSALAGAATSGPPYVFSFTNVTDGILTFFARETCQFGSVTSAPVTVLVTSNATFELPTPTLLPDGTLQFEVAGPPQLPIQILATTNLLSGSWVALLTNPPGQFLFVLPDPTNYPQRFYRAMLAP